MRNAACAGIRMSARAALAAAALAAALAICREPSAAPFDERTMGAAGDAPAVVENEGFTAYGMAFSIPALDAETMRGYLYSKTKRNREFFAQCLAPLARQAAQADLPLRRKAALYGLLVIETHRANGIGYCWGGDMLDCDPDPTARPGVGYDCSGYAQSVYQAILPESVFADSIFRINARDFLQLGREVAPVRPLDSEFERAAREAARPGDLFATPEGHVCMLGEHPLNGSPIVLSNGEYWIGLRDWMASQGGKAYGIQSAFDAADALIEPRGASFFAGKILEVEACRIGAETFLIPLLPRYVRFDLEKSQAWGTRRNRLLFDLYLAGCLRQIENMLGGADLAVRMGAFASLAAQTLERAGVGELPHGDMFEARPEYRAGAGFDDLGFVWSVWAACARSDAAANPPPRWSLDDLKAMMEPVAGEAPESSSDPIRSLIRRTQQGPPEGRVFLLSNGQIWIGAGGEKEPVYIRAGAETMSQAEWDNRGAPLAIMAADAARLGSR